MTGALPKRIYPLIARIVGEQEMVVEAALTRDLDLAFQAFTNDPLVTISPDRAKALFDEMIQNTKAYLNEYSV
jgi:alpha-galactosidase